MVWTGFIWLRISIKCMAMNNRNLEDRNLMTCWGVWIRTAFYGFRIQYGVQLETDSSVFRKPECPPVNPWFIRVRTSVMSARISGCCLLKHMRNIGEESTSSFFWSYFRVISPDRNLIPFLWIQNKSNLVRRGIRVTKRIESNAESFGHVTMPHFSICHSPRYHILSDAFSVTCW
jgi:hypothetical protein